MFTQKVYLIICYKNLLCDNSLYREIYMGREVIHWKIYLVKHMSNSLYDKFTWFNQQSHRRISYTLKYCQVQHNQRDQVLLIWFEIA